MTDTKTMGIREWVMLTTLSIVWGGSFFFVQVAVTELPTFTTVVVRVALAAIVLLLVMKVTKQEFPTDGKVLLAFLGMGLLNNVIPFSLFVWGQTQISSSLASILNATMPLFTVLVAHVLTADEKMTVSRMMGVIIGLVGVAIMVGGEALSGFGDSTLAQLACLGAALSYAFASIYGRRFRRLGVSPMATATGQVCASSLILLPAMLLLEAPWTLPMPSLPVIGSLLGVGIVSTAFAYILYFRILATSGATNISLVTFLVPVSAILLGTLILGEVLETKHLLGMAAIGIGLAAIDGRPWNHVRKILNPRDRNPI